MLEGWHWREHKKTADLDNLQLLSSASEKLVFNKHKTDHEAVSQ